MTLLFTFMVSGCNTNTKELNQLQQQANTVEVAQDNPNMEQEKTENITAQKNISAETNVETNSASESIDKIEVNGILKVHFIDVGQADSILVQHGSQNMLIDAGNNADADTVVNYIKKQGVTKLDYFIMTHPHEDHIGGADAVIKGFNIGTVYMPKVTSTTQTFKDVVTAMSAKGLKATIPVPGNTFKLGDTLCTILAPNGSSYEDLNNYSVVVKLTYGQNNFIFQGDAEDISENEILSKGYDISADVIKIGHHGSNSSSTQAYIKKVNPKYAVISVGKGNDYGHPHQETMAILKSIGIPVYRTDEAGTIICTSDGKNISFNCSPGSYSAGSGGGGSGSSSGSASNESNKGSGSPGTVVVPPTSGSNTGTSGTAENKEVTVYVTNSGEKYHRDGCKYLGKSKIPISLNDAKNEGYSPCKVCNPPQ